MEFSPPPSTKLSFISSDLKLGDPPYNWEDIRRPKLRRYPNCLSTLTWHAHLGSGADGVVLQAMAANGDLVAVKIVSWADPFTLVTILTVDKFFSNATPVPPPGARCYWPFERECRNVAILEMITTSLRHASAAGRSILVNPSPITKRDAVKNLQAFSANCSRDQSPSHFQPISLNTQINPCLGWATINGKDANQAIHAQCGIPCFNRDETYFVIVYHYVLDEELRIPVVQAQLDFFYQTGFICTPVEERNWRGPGILIDFSDLVSPHAHEWEEFTFGRLVRSKDGFYYLHGRSTWGK